MPGKLLSRWAQHFGMLMVHCTAGQSTCTAQTYPSKLYMSGPNFTRVTAPEGYIIMCLFDTEYENCSLYIFCAKDMPDILYRGASQSMDSWCDPWFSIGFWHSCKQQEPQCLPKEIMHLVCPICTLCTSWPGQSTH